MKKPLNRLNPWLARIGGILISMAFFLAGGAELFGFISMGVEMYQTKGWAQTRALIMDSYVSSVNLGTPRQQFLAEVKYQFEVNAKKIYRRTIVLL